MKWEIGRNFIARQDFKNYYILTCYLVVTHGVPSTIDNGDVVLQVQWSKKVEHTCECCGHQHGKLPLSAPETAAPSFCAAVTAQDLHHHCNVLIGDLRDALRKMEAERDAARHELDFWKQSTLDAEAARDTMEAALRQAALWFREYEASHTAKAVPSALEKARRNAVRAQACETALASSASVASAEEAPPAAAASQGRDTNVEAVRAKLLERSAVGLKKYGKPTSERTELNSADWLRHLQEELMDAAVYVQAMLTPGPDDAAGEAE